MKITTAAIPAGLLKAGEIVMAKLSKRRSAELELAAHKRRINELTESGQFDESIRLIAKLIEEWGRRIEADLKPPRTRFIIVLCWMSLLLCEQWRWDFRRNAKRGSYWACLGPFLIGVTP